MKKNLFTVAAVALVALVSCNKETNSPVQPAPVSDIKFEASIAQTKTAIGDPDETGYRNVTWVLGDQVNINGTLFTATGFKEDGKAIFETELDFTVAEQYDAIYPATAGTSLEAVTIAAAQDGTFANAAIAVAQSENRSLSFLNVASLLRFQVPADYASVTIESTEDLAGTVSVSFNEELPVIGEVKNASKTVTLKNVKAGVDYYVAILPGDHKFTVRLGGYLSKASTKAVTLERSQIMNLGTLPELEKFGWGLVGQHQGWDIAKPTVMYKVYDGVGDNNVNDVYAVLNVKLSADGFKFAKFGLSNWNGSNTYFGAWTKSTGKQYYNFTKDCGLGRWYGMWTDSCSGQSENIGVDDWTQNYDVYIKMTTYYTNSQNMNYTIVTAGTAMTF